VTGWVTKEVVMNMNLPTPEIGPINHGDANRLAAPPPRTETRSPRVATMKTDLPERKHRLAHSLVIAALLGAGYAGYGWWNYAHTWVATDNAAVSGHVHAVSTRLAGTVSEVLVSENQPVAAGTVLARLDPRDLTVACEKANAALAQAEAQVEQARAQVLRDETLTSKAQADFDRAQQLVRGGTSVISRQEFDTAKAAVDAASAALKATKALELAAEAQVKVATAQVKDAELQEGYTEIVAPAAGRIGRKNLEVGNRVQAGQSLLAVVEPEVWVTANYKETQLERLHPGQRARLEVDSFPGQKFTGTVESLSPASGAEFALLPPDNATGNFTKIVQRVPVKIVFDKASVGNYAGRIAPGMSVVVQVNVREKVNARD